MHIYKAPNLVYRDVTMLSAYTHKQHNGLMDTGREKRRRKKQNKTNYKTHPTFGFKHFRGSIDQGLSFLICSYFSLQSTFTIVTKKIVLYNVLFYGTFFQT